MAVAPGRRPSEARYVLWRDGGPRGRRVPGGWVGIVLHDGRFGGAYLRAGLAALLADAPAAAVVGVDIPVGLPDHGWRAADTLAAARIGARRSSVFRVPPRAAWACDSYPEANRVCRELTGAGFSVQAYGLRRKLLEAEALDARLYEVHPEVSFRELAGPRWRTRNTDPATPARAPAGRCAGAGGPAVAGR